MWGKLADSQATAGTSSDRRTDQEHAGCEHTPGPGRADGEDQLVPRVKDDVQGSLGP